MKITVIIPTINAKKEWLTRAFESCSFADEVIVTKEKGLSAAVNNAVRRSLGDFLSILPDDDFFLPEIEQIAEIARASKSDIIHFPCKHWNEEQEVPGLFDVSPGITCEENLKGNKIFGSSFIHKDVFNFLNGYNGDVCMDWDLFNKALRMGAKFQYVDIPGAVFRWNTRSRLQSKFSSDFINNYIKDSFEKWEQTGCCKAQYYF
jgi:glycosyltransferase involved in cell wall biosynthesis